MTEQATSRKTGLKLAIIIIILAILVAGVIFTIRKAPRPSAPPAATATGYSPSPGQAPSGDELFIKGDFPGARKAYLNQLAKQPNSVALITRMGYVSEMLKNPDEMNRYYSRALELDPYNPRLYRDYTEALLSLARFEDAAAIIPRFNQQFSNRKLLDSDIDLEILQALAKGSNAGDDRLCVHLAYMNLDKLSMPSRNTPLETRLYRERVRNLVDLATQLGKGSPSILAQATYYTGLGEAFASNNQPAIGKIAAGIAGGLTDPSNTMNAHTLLFMLALRQGDYKQAKAYMEDCRRMLKEYQGPETNRFAPLMESIYFLSTVYGLGDAGVEKYRELLPTYEALKGKGVPDKGVDIVKIRELLHAIAESRAARDEKKTVENLQALINVCENSQSYCPEFNFIIRTSIWESALVMLGDIYRDRGDAVKARTQYEKAASLVPSDTMPPARLGRLKG